MSNLKLENLSNLANSLDDLSSRNNISTSQVLEIEISNIKVLVQHRKDFDENDLNNLALSIKKSGVLQPVLVRVHTEEKGKYILVAGERRLRACIKNKMDKIPVCISKVSNELDHNIAQLAENTARKDLNSFELLEAFIKLKSLKPEIKIGSIAGYIGKSRRFISDIAAIAENKNTQKFLSEKPNQSVRELKSFLNNYDGILNLKDISYDVFLENFNNINNPPKEKNIKTTLNKIEEIEIDLTLLPSPTDPKEKVTKKEKKRAPHIQ